MHEKGGTHLSFVIKIIVKKKSALDLHLWQYRLLSFQGRDTKLERFLAKNQYAKRKLLNLENWSSGELSKIGYHFRK